MTHLTNNEFILIEHINKLDPFEMMQFEDPYIYLKEVKLILNTKYIASGKIKDIFKIGYSTIINENSAKEIYSFLLMNNLNLK